MFLKFVSLFDNKTTSAKLQKFPQKLFELYKLCLLAISIMKENGECQAFTTIRFISILSLAAILSFLR